MFHVPMSTYLMAFSVIEDFGHIDSTSALGTLVNISKNKYMHTMAITSNVVSCACTMVKFPLCPDIFSISTDTSMDTGQVYRGWFC